MDWVHEISEIIQKQLMAIEGKTSHQSHDRTKRKEAIHLVSA
jgi:hypothetical protein